MFSFKIGQRVSLNYYCLKLKEDIYSGIITNISSNIITVERSGVPWDKKICKIKKEDFQKAVLEVY